MRCGIMYETGDVVLSYAPFADTNQIKLRPAVILFIERGNIVMAGVTSNPEMKGIPITKKEGLVVDSIIKTNYVFTTSESRIQKLLTKLSPSRRQQVYDSMISHLNGLIE